MAQALGWALALVVVATAIGAALRWTDGRARRGSGERIRPDDVQAPGHAFGGTATLLQFSTETCARCPAQRRLLAAVAGATEGVRHVEVDLTHRTDLASRYRVLQTPTTFVLDHDGLIAARIPGVATRDTILRALGTATTKERP